MRIHLVSYATPKFRHRQLLLAASGKANDIIQSVTSWTSSKLAKSQFPELAPDISLNERGSGFWAWKPFIILQALQKIPAGDIVLYSDVGRKFPYIILDRPVDGFIKWLNEHNQDMVPGVMIPWNGPMSMWTKRDALIATSMDRQEIHQATPIQASFSFWRNTPQTRQFVKEWLSLCIQRKLVSDDPSADGLIELSDFKEHRHDQSLLNLCCIKHGIKGVDLGPDCPNFNERDPGMIASHMFNSDTKRSILGLVILMISSLIQWTERLVRKCVNL